jgi:outer membrane scaffolding protein for murein synthesis (MipA/OmpV family)
MTNLRRLALAVLLTATSAAHAAKATGVLDEGADAAVAQTPFNYVLGTAVSWRPDGVGSRSYETKPSLLWAIRWGRWRISAGRANALFGFGREVSGTGASTELINGERWRVGLALRFDSGRKSSDSLNTAGLPDIERTLRGRVYTSYALSPDWQLSGSLSQDLLGRHGGLLVGLDLGWRLRETASTEWTAGVGIGAADVQHMRSYFGVTPTAASSAGLPTFAPSAGLRDVHVGVGVTRALSPRWVAFGSAGVSRLLGPAAQSPLTQKLTGAQVAVGLAYRN